MKLAALAGYVLQKSVRELDSRQPSHDKPDSFRDRRERVFSVCLVIENDGSQVDIDEQLASRYKMLGCVNISDLFDDPHLLL